MINKKNIKGSSFELPFRHFSLVKICVVAVAVIVKKVISRSGK